MKLELIVCLCGVRFGTLMPQCWCWVIECVKRRDSKLSVGECVRTTVKDRERQWDRGLHPPTDWLLLCLSQSSARLPGDCHSSNDKTELFTPGLTMMIGVRRWERACARTPVLLSLIHPTRVLSVSPRASWQMVMLWTITLLYEREGESVQNRNVYTTNRQSKFLKW